MSIYYISDTHFGHANIIRLSNRPFRDIAEMNAELIARWNAKVTDDDDVYMLGDFAYRSAEAASVIAGKLKGRKHLVIGNHDNRWMKEPKACAQFVEIARLMEIDDGGRLVTLCHYPMMSWHDMARERGWHVHGHIHENTDAPYWPLLKSMDKALNACVEVNGYEPVAFDELLENNRVWKAAH